MENTKQTLVTYKTVMKELDISRPTLWRLIRDGHLHVVYVGTAPRIEWAEVENFIATRRQS